VLAVHSTAITQIAAMPTKAMMCLVDALITSSSSGRSCQVSSNRSPRSEI